MRGTKPAYGALLCASILVLCSVLSIDQDEVAVGPHAKSVRLPCLCLFKNMTGQDCPVCGMTRSLISIGHLDLRNGWRYNRAGLLVYILIVYQLIAGLLRVAGGRRAGLRAVWRPMTTRAYYALSAVLFVAWIIRLVQS